MPCFFAVFLHFVVEKRNSIYEQMLISSLILVFALLNSCKNAGIKAIFILSSRNSKKDSKNLVKLGRIILRWRTTPRNYSFELAFPNRIISTAHSRYVVFFRAKGFLHFIEIANLFLSSEVNTATIDTA